MRQRRGERQRVPRLSDNTHRSYEPRPSRRRAGACNSTLTALSWSIDGPCVSLSTYLSDGALVSISEVQRLD